MTSAKPIQQLWLLYCVVSAIILLYPYSCGSNSAKKSWSSHHVTMNSWTPFKCTVTKIRSTVRCNKHFIRSWLINIIAMLKFRWIVLQAAYRIFWWVSLKASSNHLAVGDLAEWFGQREEEIFFESKWLSVMKGLIDHHNYVHCIGGRGHARLGILKNICLKIAVSCMPSLPPQ